MKKSREIKLALAGFGHVGRAFAELLLKKREWLHSRELSLMVTGILNSKGGILDPEGIDLEKLISFVKTGKQLSEYPVGGSDAVTFQSFMEYDTFDTLVEMSPTDLETGGPAMEHITTSLEMEKNVITANKGPILLKYHKLKQLADAKGLFLGIGCTTGGALPSVTAGQYDAAGSEILSIEGILNGTTNYILNLMEMEELSYKEALKATQDMGLAEKDPSRDVDGWDTATKLLILSNVLMGSSLSLNDIEVKGITGITPIHLEEAAKEGKRYKLIGKAEKENGTVKATVSIEKIGPDNFLYGIEGSGKAVLYRTDTLGDLLVANSASGPSYAAASLLRDLVNLA
jgi:homoserine dehydrogenase